MTYDFMGVPLGTYNFGGPVGNVSVGDTDTIVQRLQNATPASPTVNIQLDALQLESTAPINLGAGLNNYFITLQSTPSVGQMTIDFTDHTFTSSLDVFFDVHVGSLNGPVVAASDLVLQNSGTPWSNIAPPDAVLIDTINNDLNTKDNANDFWPGSTFTEQHPGGGSQHTVGDATAPDSAATLPLLLLSLAGLKYVRDRLAVSRG